MKVAIAVFVSVAALVQVVSAQTNRDWVKMSSADALKILNDSPWGRTYTETDTSEMFFSPTSRGTSSLSGVQAPTVNVREQQARNNSRADRGALNQAVSVDYHVRFFSSRPIREALSRIVLLTHPEPGPQLIKQWQEFVERDFGEYVVVTVTCGSNDGRLLGPNLQAFDSATTGSIRNQTYLERTDGKRVFLIDYRPPGEDGLGAKFIFPRFLDGERFLISPKGTVRFVTDLGKETKLNVRFDLKEMVFNDRLDY